MPKPRITHRKPRKPNWCSEHIRDVTATGLERTLCETTEWVDPHSDYCIQTTRVHVHRNQTLVHADLYTSHADHAADFGTIVLRDDNGNETTLFFSLSQMDLLRQALANPREV